jgi:hypothetical protein
MLEKQNGVDGLDSSGTAQTAVEGSCEYDEEISSFIKFREILEQLNNWQLFKNSAPFSQSVQP